MSIKVNFGAMEAGAAQISGAANSIHGALEDLKRFLQPLVHEWDGAAKEAYMVQQHKWDQAANDLNHILQQIGHAVTAANENYTGAEKSNASIWGS